MVTLALPPTFFLCLSFLFVCVASLFQLALCLSSPRGCITYTASRQARLFNWDSPLGGGAGCIFFDERRRPLSDSVLRWHRLVL